MSELLMKEGSGPTWLPQAVWWEWLQPSLYALLVIALVSLIGVLLDLALICWKELHTAPTKARITTTPGSETAATTPVRFAKRQDRSKVILRLTKAVAINRGVQPHQPTQQTTAQR